MLNGTLQNIGSGASLELERIIRRAIQPKRNLEEAISIVESLDHPKGGLVDKALELLKAEKLGNKYK